MGVKLKALFDLSSLHQLLYNQLLIFYTFSLFKECTQAIKNVTYQPTTYHQISLYCHCTKIIKEPGTSFQSSELNQKYSDNVSHDLYYPLVKFHLDTTDYSKEII